MLTKIFYTFLLINLIGCSSFLSSSGPSRRQVNSADSSDSVKGITLLDVDSKVTQHLVEARRLSLFSEVFPQGSRTQFTIGPGDVVEVIIWEAPPRALFVGEQGVFNLPHQMVNDQGEINMPFVGQVNISGKSTEQAGHLIAQRIRGKANQPQVLVRVVNNNSSLVTVVGDVTQSRQIPLTYRGERLLDALAAAGGVKQEVNKTTLQITRGERVSALPLDTIIRDPKQNIHLMPGDIVTSLYKSLSFTVLGATGANSEINFEAQGISLAQALARSGGLHDNRADAEGVFIFRFEKEKALNFLNKKIASTPNGKIPVVYRINLNDPSSLFVAQNFPIEHGDVLYVANSSQAQLQKFLNLIQSVAISTLGVINLEKNVNTN